MMVSQATQVHWASHKYLVMAHSQKEYNYIRQLFKGNEWSATKELAYYQALKRAQNTPSTLGALTNAYQHVWGYFKHLANDQEKSTFQKRIKNLTLETDLVHPFLQALSQKYHITYLLKSKLLFS